MMIKTPNYRYILTIMINIARNANAVPSGADPEGGQKYQIPNTDNEDENIKFQILTIVMKI